MYIDTLNLQHSMDHGEHTYSCNSTRTADCDTRAVNKYYTSTA